MKKNKLFSFVLVLIPLLSFGQDFSEISVDYGHNSYELLIRTVNRESLKPIDDVSLYLYEMPEDSLVATEYTVNGFASFFIDPRKEYKVETCKRLHINGGINVFNCFAEGKIFCLNGASEFNYTAGGGINKPNALLEAKIALDSVSVGKTFKLENVYYDTGKWNLRRASKKELNKLIGILEQFPSMIVELSSHTDSRGSDEFNMELSAKRAQSCYDYLIEKGISPERVIPRGYGETKLTNGCTNGVNCSDRKHQPNRRTEFTVLSFEGVDCT